MIFISAHKDFDLKNNMISNDYTIIDRNELKNKYPIHIIHETPATSPLMKYYKIYGELTKIYYVYKHLDTFPHTDRYKYIGFVQYRRTLANISYEECEKIFENYDVILPEKNPLTGDIMFQYRACHSDDLLECCIKLIGHHMPVYRKSIEKFRMIKWIYPHNIFVMKRNDFRQYCKFLFNVFDLLIRYKIKMPIDKYEFNNFKEFGLIAERLSTLFFIHYFDEHKTYHTATMYKINNGT